MQDYLSETMEALPRVRGTYRFQFPLHTILWFKTGGGANVLFKPADLEDLCNFLKNRPSHLPVHLLGAGSNTIVRDSGYDGIIIKLGRGFNKMTNSPDGSITVGASVLDRNVAQYAAQENIENMEFLYGIPGQIGGAVKMNAGCYNHEMADIFTSMQAVDLNGCVHTMTHMDMGFGYRSSTANQLIFTQVSLKGHRVRNNSRILTNMKKISEARSLSQPTSGATGGSTFKNPTNTQNKAWELIDSIGGRAMCVGGASVSTKHCNFLINNGTASSRDLEELGNKLRDLVYTKHHITLEWEIAIIGKE